MGQPWEQIFTVLIDITVIVFDLWIYTRLTELKHNNTLYRVLMYAFCTLILGAYMVGTLVLKLSAIMSSFVFMTIPSLLLFLLLSKYKDARFFVTFCLVDTVSLVFAFFGRAVALVGGEYGTVLGFLLVLALFTAITVAGNKYSGSYRALLGNVKSGWETNMVAMVLIYILLVFAAAYPKPIAERPEYIPVYFAISVTVLAFYAVFITTVSQKKSINDLNERLKNELHWHHVAFYDGLTNMKNRMAYMERINEISRIFDDDWVVFTAILDIDNFKVINDTFGHHVGDEMLKEAANKITEAFGDKCYETFRIGGDEFAVISINADNRDFMARLEGLNSASAGLSFKFSYGISAVDSEELNAVENSFIRADIAMYKQKHSKKAGN